MFGVGKSKIDPLEIAEDKAIDALAKKYFSRLAPILEWAGSPIAEALKAFFDSSEIATDYDELRLIMTIFSRKSQYCCNHSSR
jgi:hypothetical protein